MVEVLETIKRQLHNLKKIREQRIKKKRLKAKKKEILERAEDIRKSLE